MMQSIYLRNTAGMDTREATREVSLELMAARIPIVDASVAGPHSECAAEVSGDLAPFVLMRAWVYWMVRGVSVPFEIAKEMYNDPRDTGGSYGDHAIRVEGNCTCPEPTRDVTQYHIDTVDGLALFVETMRKHGLTR